MTITAQDVTDAMTAPILLITKSANGRKFTGVRKDIYFRPSTGEFIISASGRLDKLVTTRAQAAEVFNAIDLGKL